ncbi:hypothetical protein ABXS75_07225 [Roseburia hominis]
MKALVLGNINSKWVKEYIEYVLLPLGHSITVLGNVQNCKYKDFYLGNSITINKEVKARGIIGRIPFLRVISSSSRIVNRNHWDTYDVIINMFVNYRDLRICKKIRSSNSKIILYYTGSDLLRKNKLQLWINRALIPDPDYIVVGSSTLAEAMKNKYPLDTEFEIIRFGISAFESLDNYKNDKHPALSNNCFCIGYSGVREHNHIDVINIFDKIPSDLKKEIKLVVPMTYAATQEYIEEVKLKLDRTGIKYNLPTHFMDNDAMAEMWSGINFFINAQTTDSLSASVLEALYAGAVLVNAAWLDYPEYKEFGIKYLRFNSYEELFDILIQVLTQKTDYSSYIASANLKKCMSWQSAKENWSGLFSRFDNA